MTSVKRPGFSPPPRPLAGGRGAAQKAPGGEALVRPAHRDCELLDRVDAGGFFPPSGILGWDSAHLPPPQHFTLAETTALDVEGLASENEAHLPKGPGHSILVRGSSSFVEQGLQALTALRETKAGAQLLSALDKVKHEVIVRETADGNFAHAKNLNAAWLGPDGKPGKGCDATVYFNPMREVIGGGTEPWMTRPPMVGLFHELRHANFYARGELQAGDTDGEFNRELAVLGYPYDHDADPKTKPVEPPQPTENALRAELGLPLRPLAQANPVDHTPT